MKKSKKIKDRELDLRIILGRINLLDKQTKVPNRDYNFYQKISNLLEQAQEILSDKYYGTSKETWPEKGLLSLLREKENSHE